MWNWICWRLRLGWDLVDVTVVRDTPDPLFGLKTEYWMNIRTKEIRHVSRYGFLPYM